MSEEEQLKVEEGIEGKKIKLASVLSREAFSLSCQP